MVNAVRVMTVGRAQVRLRKTRRRSGARMIRNGTVPVQKPRTLVPRLANQWARYTIIASLAISAGWMAGSGPILSQRAEPPTTMFSSGTNTSTSRSTDTTRNGIDASRR